MKHLPTGCAIFLTTRRAGLDNLQVSLLNASFQSGVVEVVDLLLLTSLLIYQRPGACSLVNSSNSPICREAKIFLLKFPPPSYGLFFSSA
jgi:hypothetical protein